MNMNLKPQQIVVGKVYLRFLYAPTVFHSAETVRQTAINLLEASALITPSPGLRFSELNNIPVIFAPLPACV